jgi:hypothetical protein
MSDKMVGQCLGCFNYGPVRTVCPTWFCKGGGRVYEGQEYVLKKKSQAFQLLCVRKAEEEVEMEKDEEAEMEKDDKEDDKEDDKTIAAKLESYIPQDIKFDNEATDFYIQMWNPAKGKEKWEILFFNNDFLKKGPYKYIQYSVQI